MKKALLHEWFVDYAGSEKCVESFTNVYNDFDIYSLVDFLDQEQRRIILKGKKSETSFIQNLPFSRKSFRNYLFLFPYAIEQFDFSGYDFILTNSHLVTKGALTTSEQLHITYCHSPMRYAWDLYHQYLDESGLKKGIKGTAAKATLHYLRNWDQGTANRPDYILANSYYTARRINKIYSREADVIYPPVDTDKFTLTEQKDNYYITCSRLVPYKKIRLIVEAFNKMPDKKLVVVGDGPDYNKIKRMAGKNVEMMGYLPFAEMKTLIEKARAFLFAAIEDFGIVVLESMACGTPVIALNKGGTAETVQDGFNGIHFNEQSAAAIIDAVKRFEKSSDKFNPADIAAYAEKFNRKEFETSIKKYIEDKSNIFFNK